MQSRLPQEFLNTPAGQRANAALSNCVHCGFCNATCPTYLLLGNELDGPRGRIYLIKQLLEGESDGDRSRLHLDRCLTCRNCETTCPSGVRYGQLVDVAREHLDRVAPRPLWQRLRNALLVHGLGSPRLVSLVTTLGRLASPLLPAGMNRQLRRQPAPPPEPAPAGAGRVLLHDGCVQSAMSPEINQHAQRVLARLNTDCEGAAGCCGALAYHTGDPERARRQARANLDHWLPRIEHGDLRLVSTASGCGVFLKSYAELLEDDSTYREPARRFVAAVRDLSEAVLEADPARLPANGKGRVAFQSSCTLQHGMGLGGKVEGILEAAGYELVPVAEAHLCCGSAGSYSLLQPALAGQLRERKLRNLEQAGPERIATANIGCLMHLRSGTATPVQHWITLLDEASAADG
jgi:glycolate oxidase iron-sulfur subunit